MPSVAEQIFAGLSGAISGGLKGYTWEQEHAQKNREIDNRKEVALLQAELRSMIAEMNERGRDGRSAATIQSRETIAGQNNDTRELIAGQNNDTRETIAAGRDETTRRGQDITESLGIRRDGTTRRGQDFQFDLGVMRNNTTQRGQDISATTQRRGQDITQQLGISAEGGRNTRATAANALRTEEIKSREKIAGERNRDPWASVSFDNPPTEVREGDVTRPTAQPVEVKEQPIETSQLPDATTRSPEANADQRTRLEANARSLMTKFQATSDPAQRAALRRDLERLRGELAKLTSKPGGQ